MNLLFIIYLFIIYLAIEPVLLFLILRDVGFTFDQKILFIMGSELGGGAVLFLLLSTLEIIPFTIGIILGLTLFAASAFCLVSLRLFS